jgi:HEAT repeat protein
MGGVISQITDPAVATRLLGSMSSSNLLVRQCAAYVLRQTKVKAAVPLFVKGLQDADFDIRYQCVMGLAETVEGKFIPEWAPVIDLFAKDEGKYIRAWQDWWEKEGKAKTW